MAATSLGQAVRRTVDLARWTGIDRGQPDAEAGQQRRHKLARRFARLQFAQHSGVVQRCHINGNTFSIHRYVVQEGDEVPGELPHAEKAGEIELVYLTQDDEPGQRGGGPDRGRNGL